jgi:hypothetical protein
VLKQEVAMQTKTTKLRFSPDDLADAKVRRAAEKAEKAVEKADAAKARLPSKKLRTKTTIAQAQGEKLRFGKKEIVVEETVKKPAAIGKKAAAKGAAASVSGAVHKQASEYQDDNVGVQAINETTGAAEAAVQTGDTLRYSHKLKNYHHAEKLEARADKANVEALFQKEASKNPGVASNPFSRWQQKQAIRKEYAAMKAGKESAGTAASHAVGGGAEAAKSAGKAVKEGKDIGTLAVNFVKSHSHILLILGGLLLVILIVAGSISSCSVFMQGGTNVVLDTSYTAEDADILGVEEDYKEMEEELQTRLDNIEDEYDGYDEYRISSDQIGHDPYELASYLTILFQSYKRDQVQSTLQELFESQYELTIEEEVEIRTREVEHSSTDPETGEEDTWTETEEYEYYILNVNLKNNGLGKVIMEAGLTEDEMSRYAVLMQTYGNRKELFGDNPYAVAVEDVLHYDIPGEALTDERFRRMIAEGEKYLGYPYVWGGSSPSTSFDCSGFVSWVVNHCGNGWNVGRQTAEGLRTCCSIIPRSEAKPGDLIFFKGTYNTSGASHVGIYVGDGMMLHCGKPIQYASCETSYWQSHFYCFGRLP